MLLTLSYSGPDATDLGYLLHKHPERVQTFDLSVGRAQVFYPDARDDRCTAALLLEVDPIALARSKRFAGGDASSLSHYVNDLPYASSSLLAVAIGQVFRTAMSGRSDQRPDLAASPLPLEIGLTALPRRGEPDLVTRFFGPLGWEIDETAIPLDTAFPEWGGSRYSDVVLRGRARLADALRQVYVLLPVLDDAKHYWVADDEVEKLLRSGEGWLAGHPERELITRRYLAHRRTMIADATARLLESDGTAESHEAPVTRPPLLAERRADAVLTALRDVEARRVADVGCGEGALLRRLLDDPAYTSIVGTDVSGRALRIADERLGPRTDRRRERVSLLLSSATYRDERLRGLDAIVLMEVVEHLDASRLPDLETAIFGDARPRAVVVTTPNVEYNALFPALAAGAFRHPDHRFEWGRREFAAWAEGVAERHGYTVEHRPVGDEDAAAGAPTQLALFRRADP